MQTSWGVAAVIAAVVGAGAGAAATSALKKDSAEAAQTLDSIQKADQQRKEEIQALQAELRTQKGLLAETRRDLATLAAAREQAAALAAAPAPYPKPAAAETAAAPGETASGGSAGALPSSPALQAQMQEVVAQELKKQEEERRKRQQERQEKMMTNMLSDRLDRVSEQLKLNEYQKTEMKKIFDQGAEKMRGLFGSFGPGGGDGPPPDFTKMRETFAKVREEGNQAAKGVLTPQQYDDYLKWQDENDPPFMRFGRGGGGAGQGQGQGPRQ